MDKTKIAEQLRKINDYHVGVETPIEGPQVDPKNYKTMTPEQRAGMVKSGIKKVEPVAPMTKKQAAEELAKLRKQSPEFKVGEVYNETKIDAGREYIDSINRGNDAIIPPKDAKLSPDDKMAKAVEQAAKAKRRVKSSDFLKANTDEFRPEKLTVQGSDLYGTTKAKGFNPDYASLGYDSKKSYNAATRGGFQAAPINRRDMEPRTQSGAPQIVNLVIDGKAVGHAVIPWMERGANNGLNNLTTKTQFSNSK